MIYIYIYVCVCVCVTIYAHTNNIKYNITQTYANYVAMSVQADCWCLEPDSIDSCNSTSVPGFTMFHHNTMPRHNVILVLTDLDPNLGSDQSAGHFLMWLETMAESRVLVMGPLGYRISSVLSQWKTKEGSLCSLVMIWWSEDTRDFSNRDPA